MSDDYLWDGSGKPDPEVEKLESVLGRLRLERPAPVFPAAEAMGAHSTRFSVRWLRPGMVAAFAVVLIAAGLGLLWRWQTDVASGWDVTSVTGVPRVGKQSVGSEGGRLGLGQALETDGNSSAEIRIEEIGKIQVDPDTRLRVLSSPSGGSRLALERGTIHARIWALPGIFVVDTPSARAVDLGCAYTLHVDDSGDGLIRTTMGWVGFKLGDREAFIPAGAACVTRAKNGPRTPYFEDAPEGLRTALTKMDLPTSTEDERNTALRTLLAESRPRDALTLWHLLSRVEEPKRGAVFDRLASLVPPPTGVTREGILRLDRGMLDRWWDALDLGNIWLWRHWERSWSEHEQGQK
jgi:FecR protein